jgi:ankyrin repeat protein
VAGNAAAAALLLEQKADVNLANDSGFTPLMAAARLGSGSCARLLCEHKADVRAELPDGRCGQPACQTSPDPRTRSINGTRPRRDGRTALDLALATHEEGEQGAEEQTNAMALPPESAMVLSLLQQMEDEQFEADEQAAVAEVEAQAATEVEHAVRRSSEALSPTQRK